LFDNVLIIWVAWEILQTEKDFEYLFKLITVVIFISCIYGLFEFIIAKNPLQLYEATLNGDVSKVINFAYSTSGRGYRINSIFEHAIGAGINWSIYLGFVLYSVINVKRKLPYNALSIVTACLCCFCIVTRNYYVRPFISDLCIILVS
jgi:hypothetical protein